MKRATRSWLVALLAVMLIALLAVLFSAWLLTEPLAGAAIVIDDERVVLRGFDTPHAALLIFGGAALLIMALMLALVVVVLAVIAAALGIALAFLASTAAVLVSISPLLLVGWIIWRVLRKPDAGPASPTAPFAAS